METEPKFDLRPLTDDDSEFLKCLFAETNGQVFEGLQAEQKSELMEMQLSARETGWRTSYPSGRFQLIVVESEAAGLWYTAENEDSLTLIYAALSRKYRGRGIVAALTRQWMMRVKEMGKPIEAHVEATNPAMAIWVHLGFKVISTSGVYTRLKYC